MLPPKNSKREQSFPQYRRENMAKFKAMENDIQKHQNDKINLSGENMPTEIRYVQKSNFYCVFFYSISVYYVI